MTDDGNIERALAKFVVFVIGNDYFTTGICETVVYRLILMVVYRVREGSFLGGQIKKKRHRCLRF